MPETVLSPRTVVFVPRWCYAGGVTRKGAAAAGQPVRLRDRDVLVLTSLASGAKHAYALVKDVESFAGVRLGPGGLYNSLSKLEAFSLVEALPAEDRRHPYQLTEAGREALHKSLAESERLVNIGMRRLREAVVQ
jgi:DNA-binding PadR family transcriptional regulator